ncbi:MAG: enoyl-CoA hydratase/isomerase family protein [Bryobacterales bacterium]|nr:enoyl-CoA hydratase/isomerase family protein [Bryobacterales bacterium]MBV9400875.1 enoyl-CoA hydratase/isomerase family protein [Bryobacterales bacterium]
MEQVQYRIEDRIAILTIENPPVNALSARVQESFQQALARAIDDSKIDAIVLTGSGNTFIAGADIKDLQRMANEGAVPSILPRILFDVESAPKPVVAAIHGNAFGGGLEVALAAHYRIATADARIGQPEVKLGIIPGAGGTQRLPRLAGLEAALEMCAFGEPVRAEDAQRFGIVDRVVEENLLGHAMEVARELSGVAPRRTRELAVNFGNPESNAALFAGYRERVPKTRKKLLAPLAAIDAIEAATQSRFEEGCRKEREIFHRMLVSSQAKALIHVFFAERAARKIPAASSAHGEIQAAAVVGAGTMGRGIAMCFADAGIPVRLKEAYPEALASAIKAIEASYESSVRKGRIADAEMRTRFSKIQPQLDYAGFEAADIIVEAAFENLEVKRVLFSELAGVAKPGAILATNTSYLNIDDIAQACPLAESVIGLHFFSPANVMRLLEVAPGKATSARVTAAALALAKRLGKIAIVAGNCPGFIGNRMLRVYRREAQLLLEEGASPQQVDRALEEWGMAMGPFAAQDLAGIDIAMSSRHVFSAMEPPELRQPRVMEMLYALGRFGQKTGAGWYAYDEKRNALPDPKVDALIETAASEAGATRRPISNEEIVERAVYALVNEGARILEDGCARRASDIDLVYINGYGFPAYRGGPMHYADEAALDTVHQRVLEFGWKPAPLLTHLAKSRSSFSAFDAKASTLRAAADDANADHA